ncbi:hypothetical protein AKO1_010258 [Acrasis kona]|uniref:Carboxypeptidase Q n=1 Tax=Acrasis kona TaxID=1008807 RepID=A0AAW2ZRY0_9EUKA
MIAIISVAKIKGTYTSPLQSEVLRIKTSTDLIIKNLVDGEHSGKALEIIEAISYKFGPRLLGSQPLESALTYVSEMMKKDGFENVVLETVPNVTHWVRGEESLKMTQPREAEIVMLGLGGSVATPPEGITAPIILINSFEELEVRKDEVQGKIVLYNYNSTFTSYGQLSKYRTRGASQASKFGAVASLVRSLASFSMRTPHTGVMYYEKSVTKIPGAAVSVEDADMITWLIKHGENVVVTLKMNCQDLSPAISHNVYGDIVGSKYPDEIIVVGGHMDSWDVGTGANDDLGGAIVCYQAIKTIVQLGLKPLRTLRFIGWTGEEWGSAGATQYRLNHLDQLKNHVFAFESDSGVFSPSGISLATRSNSTTNVVSMIVNVLCKDLNTTIIRSVGCESIGQDTKELCAEGITTAHPITESHKYMWYHHSHADTPYSMNNGDLDKMTAMISAIIYAVANLENRLN